MRNFVYLSSAEVASKLVTFAAIAYLARVLAPAGFGYIEFAGSVLLCAALIVDQGFGPYGAREIAKAPHRSPELFTEIVAARFILAVFAYGAVLLFALMLDRSVIVTRLLLIYGLSLFGLPLLLQWVFQGHDQMGIVAAMQVIRQTAYAVVVFGLVRTEEQIWLVAIAEIVGVACAGVYGLWVYRRRFGKWSSSRLTISRRLFREGVPIGASQAFWMLRMFGATVILGLIASPQDVGFFGAAMRILIALHAFIYLYYFNLLPSFARAFQQGEGKLGAMIEQSLHGVAWASIGSGIVWVMLAPVVIIGVYGQAFASAGMVLQWLAGVGVAAALSGHYRFGLIAAGQQTAEMVIQIVGSSIAVVLLPLAYTQAGVDGAAAALVVGELVVWLGAWWWSRGKLKLRNHIRCLLRPLFAGTLAIGLLLLLPPPSLGIRVAGVVLLFAAFAIVSDSSVRDYVKELASACRRQYRQQVKKGVPGATRG